MFLTQLLFGQVEELCISLQRLGPEAQRPPLHPRQAFKAQSKSKTLVGGADELSCTATQAEEAYRHAQHICWLLHTLPQQLQPPSPGWPASSSAPSTPPAPLSPAILVAEPEVQSPFFPNPGHPSPATSVAEVTARARSPSSAKAASPIVIPRSCQNCRTESTPEWRTGPHGPQTYVPLFQRPCSRLT